MLFTMSFESPFVNGSTRLLLVRMYMTAMILVNIKYSKMLMSQASMSRFASINSIKCSRQSSLTITMQRD